jgi:glycosyltransferase involved in cell wall biosynthesis
MNIPSFYQNDLFNELNQHFDTFEVVYAHAEDNARKSQGWNFKNHQNYLSRTIGVDLNIWKLITYTFKNRKATHIINGIWAEKYFFFVILLLNIFGANFLIYSEAPAPTKNRNKLKKTFLEFILNPVAKLLIFRAKGILAISIFAVEYFKGLGVKSEKIHRFGYFRNVEKTYKNHAINPVTSFIFVGQLIERKGILTLLESIKTLVEKTSFFHLTIIGSGELEPILKAYIKSNSLQKLVTLQGAINSKNVVNHIQKADLLILPSTFDGWGLVVNEALQCGIPALISDQCGAKELIIHGKNGLIFQSQNAISLANELQTFMTLSPKEKAKMNDHTQEMGAKIEIAQATKYLTHCLNYTLNSNTVKPTAPWLND